jgi:hypothetical protein
LDLETVWRIGLDRFPPLEEAEENSYGPDTVRRPSGGRAGDGDIETPDGDY